jgi:hypothetical protein
VRDQGAGDIVVAESDLKRPWPYGVNIESLVLMDFDENRVLAHVEVLVRRSLWRAANSFNRSIRKSLVADVLIADTKQKSNFVEAELSIHYVSEDHSLYVTLSDGDEVVDRVVLSDTVDIYVWEGALVGMRVSVQKELP